MKLPTRIGLCPEHGEDFYYPLEYGESLRCPIYGCHEEMVVYERPGTTDSLVASGEAWQCQCGARTLSASSTCAACGAQRPDDSPAEASAEIPGRLTP